MKVLVTGGAGFIGRALSKRLMDDGHAVSILDNFYNGRPENISEFKGMRNFKAFTKGDIKDNSALSKLFSAGKFDICYHLGAMINVQESIDNPKATFDNDVVGTFNVLEQCRKHDTKMVFMSTCMVYSMAGGKKGISEEHPVKPASPYAGAKISGENMTLSYWHAYGLPTTVLRVFNTYGPFQKCGGEGGVIAIFIKRKLAGQTLNIYGSGTQTRDFLYVDDCAEFVSRSGYSKKSNGEIINAGSGRDIPVNSLAKLISGGAVKIQHVKHIHPQSEIQKLLCDNSKAKKIIGWKPKIPLEKGLKLTEAWIAKNPKLV